MQMGQTSTLTKCEILKRKARTYEARMIEPEPSTKYILYVDRKADPGMAHSSGV